MRETFFISDQHYGHANILTFKDDDGQPVRPNIGHVDEMDEMMITRHNSVVKDGDTVYMLGDFVWGNDTEVNRKRLANLRRRLLGNIKFTLGNHDYMRVNAYCELPHFEVLGSLTQFGKHTPRFWISHAPLHLCNLYYKTDKGTKDWFNVHGHIHQRHVLDKHGKPDPRYINVSAECIDYTPVNIDELFK